MSVSLQKAWQHTIKLLEKMSREYYRLRRVWLPDDFPLREFAAQKWGGKSYIRHLGFMSREQVNRFLIENGPRHFYYSAARYDNPAADNMDAKGWRSSDLTFDIDADHLPECAGYTVEVESPIEGKVGLIDENTCIRKAAFRALTLYDALLYELGFERRQVSIEFSGNRGFHVTVYMSDSDEFAKADSAIRREIVNYLKAIGLKEETLEPWRTLSIRRGKPLPLAPTTSLGGARGRLARVAVRLARFRGDVEAARLLESSSPPALTDSISPIISEAKEYLSIDIDEQVTVDVHRLIRAPGSINGKTGMIVQPVKPDELEDFTVSEGLSAFRDYDSIRVKVLVSIPQTITILGNRMKLREGDTPRLPAPVAAYLMARGLAVIYGR